MSYWDGDNFLDGPALDRWLSDRIAARRISLNGSGLTSLQRRMCYWRNGSTPSVYTVDRYLAAIDIHPAEIPDEVWVG